MKKLAFLLIPVLLTLTITANAGMWFPDSSKVYSLKVESFSKYKLCMADKRWIKSLLDNLSKSGSLKSHFIFVRTNLELFLNEKPLSVDVYVNVLEDEQFLAFEEGGQRFIIDFKNEKVFIPGLGGLSLHPHISGQIIVIVEPVLTELDGVLVTGENRNPDFGKNYVSWY
jgi:hypothetical protein